MRLRFAPSPTGFLHVGGARTALFNWLLAKRHGGIFILRIEDTDRQRSSDEMTQAILEGMKWLGLEWDEGPFHQADGFVRHRVDALRLLAAGHAYRCFCTAEALEARRAAAGMAPDAFRYDRLCATNVTLEAGERRAAGGEPHTIRFRVPEGTTAWDDAVHERLEFANEDIGDFIVLRSDGTPIYNLAVVSDDIDMRITHVIRGDDHISNTPKQILLYRALGADVPVFAHVPMILGADGKRLSKRHGATAIGEYREQGLLPAAMVNFLALLGWNPGTEEEIFEPAEIAAQFSLDRINKKSAIFDNEKLAWMSGQHIMRTPAPELAPLLVERLIETGDIDQATLEDRHDWLIAIIEMLKPRARTLAEMAAAARIYIGDDLEYDEAAAAKHWQDADAVIEQLGQLRSRFEVVAWGHDALEAAVRGYAEESGAGLGKVIHPLRVALTGTAASPGIFDVLQVLGRDVTVDRIDAAIRWLQARPKNA